MSLTDTQMQAIATITGTDPEAISRSLIETYHRGPINLDAFLADPEHGLIVAARNEWIHLTRSAYCPDCLRETGGVWQLHWRLPWSFACPRHQLLLAAACPACQQPARRGRGDRTLTPGFIDNVPRPTHCHNSITANESGYDVRPGRGAKPCGNDLTATTTTDIGGYPTIVRAQTALLKQLAGGGQQETWKNLRALTATLMYFTDRDTLMTLTPTVTEPLLLCAQLAAAVDGVEQDRQRRSHTQQLRRDGGHDHRTGTRQRYSTATPTNPALMAALAPIALHLNEQDPEADSPRPERLTALAILARKQRKELPRLLKAAGASARLVTDAEHATRMTGRFAVGVDDSRHGLVDSNAIPAYLWESEAAPFLALLPATREDTTRMFASMTVVKHLTGDTWTGVAKRLGLPEGKTKTVPALVNRLTKAGTQAEFHASATSIVDRLAAGDIPTINYADRRHRFRHLTAVPAEVIQGSQFNLVVTTARKKNATVWLWTHLTGGHAWDAPLWLGKTPSDNQKEVYRRFLARDLETLRSSLIAFADELAR